MRKLIFTLLSIVILHFSGSAASPLATSYLFPMAHHTNDGTPSWKDQLRIAQMKYFITLTPETYGALKGKKLNLFEKLSFNTSQHRMKKMLKQYDYGEEPGTLQKISWLLKGLLFGPLALILGYAFLKDDDRELIKWIWFGFAGFTLIALAVLLTM